MVWRELGHLLLPERCVDGQAACAVMLNVRFKL